MSFWWAACLGASLIAAAALTAREGHAKACEALLRKVDIGAISPKLYDFLLADRFGERVSAYTGDADFLAFYERVEAAVKNPLGGTAVRDLTKSPVTAILRSPGKYAVAATVETAAKGVTRITLQVSEIAADPSLALFELQAMQMATLQKLYARYRASQLTEILIDWKIPSRFSELGEGLSHLGFEKELVSGQRRCGWVKSIFIALVPGSAGYGLGVLASLKINDTKIEDAVSPVVAGGVGALLSPIAVIRFYCARQSVGPVNSTYSLSFSRVVKSAAAAESVE